MVDATLMRHHPAVYDTVLAAHPPARRRLLVETLAGLRYVRNWVSSGTALEEAVDIGDSTWHITGWTWRPAGVPPGAQAWERARHRAYQARLAGYTIGTTIGQAVTFLTLTGSDAVTSTDTSQPPPRRTRRPDARTAM
jgi:hypothetical protein